jgi:hypothetical protein
MIRAQRQSTIKKKIAPRRHVATSMSLSGEASSSRGIPSDLRAHASPPPPFRNFRLHEAREKPTPEYEELPKEKEAKVIGGLMSRSFTDMVKSEDLMVADALDQVE